GRRSLTSAPLALALEERSYSRTHKLSVPEFVKRGDETTQRAFISGLFQMDGSITGSIAAGSCSIELGSISRGLLVDVQRLLLNHGIYTRIYKGRSSGTIDFGVARGGEYKCRQMWSLRAASGPHRIALFNMVDWRPEQILAWNRLGGHRNGRSRDAFHRCSATVLAIEPDGVEDVYDVTVENGHSVIFNGIATGNCSEILQVSTPSEMNTDLTYSEVGRDISCNLGSLNIAKAMDSPDFSSTIEASIRALTAVSDLSDISSVPTIAEGNRKSHAIGLGQMNLHGYLARERVFYGSEEGIDFTNMYFYAVAYEAIRASNRIAKERGETFYGFEDSKYADGSFFAKYIDQVWEPKTERVRELFENSSVHLPTQDDWRELAAEVAEHGLHNAYLQAIPPTGAISYTTNPTSSTHPIAAKIEIRKEVKIGRVYYPAAFMTNENTEYYQDAYEIGYEKIIDTYAAATQHVDQGLSLTLFFPSTATTRDVNRAQIYAWRKGIKTLYYIRLRQMAIEGTEVEGCVSCAL